MNPFEENESVPTISTSANMKSDITIWKESRGKKTNTYITGWNHTQDELKQYLKQFKQMKGCNGSLKNDEDEGFKLHFQGDKIDDFIEFMVSKGVNQESITVKGQ